MRILGASLLLAAALLWAFWSHTATLYLATRFSADQLAAIRSMSHLGAVPPQPTNRVAADPGAASLGRTLFFDRRLSADGTLACATCHDPTRGFSDGRRVALGAGAGRRNTPGLWNTAYGRWWMWDGRADSLWAQALLPLENGSEMATSRAAVWRLVATDSDLRNAYEQVFGLLPRPVAEVDLHASPIGDEVRRRRWHELSEEDRAAIDRVFVNVGKALEAFERTLVSADSPFDRFARGLETGDQEAVDALSPAAQRGLQLFTGRGQCTLCHHGATLSDGEFHNLGLPPLEDSADPGRYAGVRAATTDPFRGLGAFSDDPGESANRRLAFVAQKLSNLGEHKTPSLRNVALTAPYMHDGRFATLTEVVRFYGDLPGAPALGHREESLLPKKWTEAEVADLAAFLESLTDGVAATRAAAVAGLEEATAAGSPIPGARPSHEPSRSQRRGGARTSR